ncbi:MAG TPA: carbamate kinase [Streptosporangiaceae bacterium]|nr:carbamate kinase [Streptosporangiaceae bacterium]
MTKTAVVALGGNALTLPGQAGTCAEMVSNAAAMAASINEVIEAGWRVVIVHGNGPQVGNLALQQEASPLVPAQPLAMLGAMTQGQLGSILARAIDALRGPGSTAALITHVTVDRADPAFRSPTKPIGPFFDRARAEQLARDRGWVVRPDSGHGYRRVVASPEPAGIVEIDAIRALVNAGLLVIAAGGGGIPLTSGPECREFADAVIDKDRAARLLATIIGAQALLLVTAVDRVMLDFGTPRQSALTTVTADEAARHLAEGQFPPGSMGPKIEAALQFLAAGGDLAVITSPRLLAQSLTGADSGGTRIEPGPAQASPAQASPAQASPAQASPAQASPAQASPAPAGYIR